MQQYFAERPQNTSVREGQMAVLRCRVANQQGRVQWTKDGFALGKSAFPLFLILRSQIASARLIRPPRR